MNFDRFVISYFRDTPTFYQTVPGADDDEYEPARKKTKKSKVS